MIVTNKGQPVEVDFRPASENDLGVLWTMKLDIPLGSKLYADGTYNSAHLEKEISSKCQMVEAAISYITELFPRNLRARTE